MNLSHRINQIKYYFNRYGFWKTLLKCIKRVLGIKDKQPYTDKEAYEMWMENNEPNLAKINELRKARFENEPLISIIVPMYNTSEKYFEELVQSVTSQVYPHWELCLADGSVEKNDKLEEIAKRDNRIFYKFLGENKGISGNTNEALKMANGKYIVLLDHDDLLAVTALYEIVKTINEEKNADFIYSDEDKITDSGERFDPYFKPDFSPETLSVHNYITHLVCFKKELQEEVGFFDDGFNGAQDFDMVLRLTEKAKKIVHISKILYHWRAGQGSTALQAENKLYAYEAGRRACEAHIERIGRRGKVENSGEVPGIYKIKYDVIRKSKSFYFNTKQGWNKLPKTLYKFNFAPYNLR